MGSLMSKPKAPPVPAAVAPPPPPPEAPKQTDQAVLDARDDARRKAAAKSGYQGTILDGVLSEANTGKTILGG